MHFKVFNFSVDADCMIAKQGLGLKGFNHYSFSWPRSFSEIKK